MKLARWAARYMGRGVDRVQSKDKLHSQRTVLLCMSTYIPDIPSMAAAIRKCPGILWRQCGRDAAPTTPITRRRAVAVAVCQCRVPGAGAGAGQATGRSLRQPPRCHMLPHMPHAYACKACIHGQSVSTHLSGPRMAVPAFASPGRTSVLVYLSCHGLPHKWGSVPNGLARGCAVRCVCVSRSAPSCVHGRVSLRLASACI